MLPVEAAGHTEYLTSVKPTWESLVKIPKVLHVHQQWQELIFKGSKTWELRH